MCSLCSETFPKIIPVDAEIYDGFVNTNEDNNKQINIEECWFVQSNKTDIYNQYL